MVLKDSTHFLANSYDLLPLDRCFLMPTFATGKTKSTFAPNFIYLKKEEKASIGIHYRSECGCAGVRAYIPLHSSFYNSFNLH